MITRVRGTDDVLDLKLYNYMLSSIKHHLHVHNFAEINTPILEHTELFARAVGADTDIVSKEMYTLQTASGESLCLRPEGTASVIRAYIENKIEAAPWKVFLHGPMFRHERPQKGRWRQFNQLSIEVVNSKAVEHDALFLNMLNRLFSEVFKLENFVLKLNFLGCLDDRKAHKAALLVFLESHAQTICATCQVRKDKNTLRIFDCKNETCKALYQQAPKIIEHLCTGCTQEWKTLQHLLEALAISFIIDHTLVRGLDYYYNTVFEFSSQDLGAQNAFCGGGRYHLGSSFGARNDFPSFGVGIGTGRLLMLIEQNLNKLTIPQEPTLHAVIPFAAEQRPLALIIASQLQAYNLCTEVILDGSSVSTMMKRANKIGARFALILGPDEQAQGTISVKDMVNGQSTTIKQCDLVKFLG